MLATSGQEAQMRHQTAHHAAQEETIMAVLLALPAALALNAILGLILAIPGAWTFMLLMGVLHAQISHSIPAIGYGGAYPIALLSGWFYLFLTTNAANSGND
jgi:uncharacterized transporter YbjL